MIGWKLREDVDNENVWRRENATKIARKKKDEGVLF